MQQPALSQPSPEPSTGRTAKLAFVSGATGFLGLNIVAELARRGWDIVALHRPQSDLKTLARFPVRLAVGNVEDRASLERAMPTAVDTVFHAAADTSLWGRNGARQRSTNVDGTRNMVAAAFERGVKKFVHTSSSTVYGFAAARFDETTPLNGRTARFNYMRTKALAEDEVRSGIARGLDAVIVNPAVMIGRYDRHNWARLIRLASEGRLPRIPPGRASFCHAAEVARTHVEAAARGRTGENYLLGGADASFRQLIRAVGEMAGRATNPRMASRSMLRLTGRVLESVSWFTGVEPLLTAEAAAYLSADMTCRSGKAIAELDYRPASLPTMLGDYYDWLVEQKTENPSDCPVRNEPFSIL
jgi:nucleoside-diphosphate-sugar epimerase